MDQPSYTDKQLIVLIRPRGGDFIYSESEISVMLADIERCHSLRVDGVAIGVLTTQRHLDVAQNGRLVRAAKEFGLSTTLHRAFDVSFDLHQSLLDAISLGFDRILTSGGSPTCFRGLTNLSSLARSAQGRIKLLPGGGITPESFPALLDSLLKLGVTEFHASARVLVEKPLDSVNSELCRLLDIEKRFVCDAKTVAKLRAYLSSQSNI